MAKHVLTSSLSYDWQPFTLDSVHLTFAQHVASRLERSRCSHWGNAVYKWQGPISTGPNAGKTGVLIGETKNLRQRIKQYISGTQERGNKLWRQMFLTQGDIRLYVLDISEFLIGEVSDQDSIQPRDALLSNNMRLVLEQLLVMQEVAKRDEHIWIVNARR